jgi:hypothetical protein
MTTMSGITNREITFRDSETGRIASRPAGTEVRVTIRRNSPFLTVRVRGSLLQQSVRIGSIDIP